VGGAELWNINGENRSPTLEKEKLPVPNIPWDEWENRSTRGKNPLVGRRERGGERALLMII